MDARKSKVGPREALTLARRSERVVAAKGAKVVVFDMKSAPPKDQELLAALIGPSGALRAPALQIGGTLVVGFSEGEYRKLFG